MKPRWVVIVVVVIVLFWLCLQDETEQTLGKAQNMTVQQEFEQWIDSVLADRQPKGEYRVVGTLPIAVILKLTELQTIITTPEIIITDEKVLHALREVKQNRKRAVTVDELKSVINYIANPSVLLYDKEKKNILFIVNRNDLEKIKLVCEINYVSKINRKNVKTNLVVTIGVIANDDLRNDKYIEI